MILYVCDVEGCSSLLTSPGGGLPAGWSEATVPLGTGHLCPAHPDGTTIERHVRVEGPPQESYSERRAQTGRRVAVPGRRCWRCGSDPLLTERGVCEDCGADPAGPG
jgi:hypothetical protein